MCHIVQTVVDNAVAWRTQKENKKSLLRDSPEYNGALRETMIYLLTKPSCSDGRNVIQRCIELGASDLLAAILNTDNVYRFVILVQLYLRFIIHKSVS